MSDPDLTVAPETEPVVSRSTVAGVVSVALTVLAAFGVHVAGVSDVWLTIATAGVNLLVLVVLAVKTRRSVFSPATVASLLGTRRSG
jgi:hypothetical protein